ncbi:phenol hydroxylase [Marinobacter salinus]|uniref:Phenol hydroxylase n=1 Tax=Marinobacter salinus TaxID=1874317 RepID=A0A1D9GRN5_9GAMM|nr:phenol hydroxylase subunit P4 [Marinobacter salinus]AOY90288.1 phenol hydroxylase [Marinobacter salinus]
MSVNALYDYKFEPRDKVENFHGMQLLYLYWPHHLMYCSPFAFLVQPDMTFGAFIEEVLKPAVAAHPDAGNASFLDARWQLNGEPFTPDASATLKDSGIDHKSMLTVITPELNGIAGSAS